MIRELIESEIANVTPETKEGLAKRIANIKVDELTKLDLAGEHQEGKLTIEIVSVSKRDVGIEVLARAFEGGEQIGFGDGTVDIERFLIQNVPILVPDENGDVIRVGKAGGDNDGTREFKFREDPKAALVQMLRHVIEVKQEKHDSSRIIPGKIGSTTSTFYPNASPESTSVDGRAEESTATSSWATLIGGAGDGADDSAAQENVVIWGDNGTSYTKLTRAAYLFDTSAIPDTDTISAATMSVQIYAKAIAGTPTPTYNVYASNPASNTAVVAGDFDSFGSTAYSDAPVTYASISIVVFTNWALNATGIAAIDKAGITKLAVREATYDVAASAPTKVNGQTYVNGYFADQALTTLDPVLVVEHAAGGAIQIHSNLALLGVG